MAEARPAAREGIDVDDRDPRLVGPQHDPQAIVGHVVSDELQARVAVDHLPQTAVEEIVKARDDDAYGCGVIHCS